MNNLFSLLISLLLIALTSCGKSKEVKIIAKNAATGTPYAGLEYAVVSSRTAANGEKYKTEASGTLNSNGEAMVSIKQKSGRTYSIRVTEPANTCYNKQITQFFDSPFDVNGTFTFEFAACAYLKFSVHNIECINSNDQIKFRRLWMSKNETNSFVTQSGCFQYQGDYFSLPMGDYIYEWEVKRMGMTNYYDSSFTLTPNQYFEFNLNY